MKYLIIVTTLACASILAQTSDWERRLDESHELMRRGQYAEAHRRLSDLMEFAKRSEGTNDIGAHLLNDLGGVCFALGRYHEAQWAYAESLRLLQTRSSETKVPDANEGMVRSALGVVYGRLGNYKDAAELLDGALLIFERTVGMRHSDFAIALNNLADVRRMQGRFGEAESLLRRALPILEETLGPKDRRVIIARANLAWFCARLGRGLEADALSAGAVAAMEGQVGPNHPLLAEVLYIRADVLKLAKRKAEAKLTYERAQRLMQTYRRETGVGLTTDLHELSRPSKRFANAPASSSVAPPLSRSR